MLDETKSSVSDFTNDLKLIKALLLHENNYGRTALVYKQMNADEWNRMEGKLQDEAFWTFINPNPDAPRYEFSRMGFVFEMLLRCEKDENDNFVDVGAQLSRNKHYLSERCLSAMMETETKEVPFLQSDQSLSELIYEEFGLPVVPKEITCEEIRPGYSFQESCQGTVPEAIIAFLDSTDFESAVRLAVSLGGDSDTLACITGGIAEAYYKEIPEEIVKEMWSRLPETFREILREMERDWGYSLKGNVG